MLMRSGPIENVKWCMTQYKYDTLFNFLSSYPVSGNISESNSKTCLRISVAKHYAIE